MQRDWFDAISPLDHRYWASEPDLFERLAGYLSENAYIRYQLRVEVALVQALARRGVCPMGVAAEVAEAAERVRPADVYEHEKKTQHNVRALVNALRERVGEEARPFIHFTATSVDILDTARALQYRDVTEQLLFPELWALWQKWAAIARREAGTPQVGRTHGQHAVPITFGFAVAEYVSRLGGRIAALTAAARNLRGKMAGAVGAYNASSLFFEDPEAFEQEVLTELGLLPGVHATQIVEPEYWADYAHALISTFGVLANFADDMRHLQRTEIGEVGEAFDAAQVGSSTMPHKRNPWNFEHVKSMWKAFMPRLFTVYLDQISEHQRDLTNSASSRFLPEIAAGLAEAAHRLDRISARLVVDAPRMQAHVTESAPLTVAEPLYILLAAAGHPDAHEAVRQLTLRSAETGRPVLALAESDPGLSPFLARLTPSQRAILDEPEQYTGIAAAKARAVCDFWEARLADIAAGSVRKGALA